MALSTDTHAAQPASPTSLTLRHASGALAVPEMHRLVGIGSERASIGAGYYIDQPPPAAGSESIRFRAYVDHW